MRLKKREWLIGAATAILGSVSSQAYAACTFGTSGEPSLQGTLNTLLGSASVNVQTACLADGSDSIWNTVGSTGIVNILIELAGNAASNTYGIYDPINGHMVRLFEGDDGAGVTGIVTVTQTAGNWSVKVKDSHGDASWTTLALSSSVFGFYLGTASNGTFYSDTSRNTDGVDHMYAYGPLTGNSNFEGDFLQAWEDLNSGGDRDYQDFVVTLSDVTPVAPVPLPAALPLLMSGLGLFGGLFSRRRAAA